MRFENLFVSVLALVFLVLVLVQVEEGFPFCVGQVISQFSRQCIPFNNKCAIRLIFQTLFVP